MDKLTSELFDNCVSLSYSPIRIILVDRQDMWGLRQTLDSTAEFQVIDELRHDDPRITDVGIESPDIVVVLADDEIPTEVFYETLVIFQKMHLNSKTIVLADNPTVYLEYAVKAKVAALLYRQISLNDLIPIIHEVYSWSHDLPNSLETSLNRTNLVLRLNQEVKEM